MVGADFFIDCGNTGITEAGVDVGGVTRGYKQSWMRFDDLLQSAIPDTITIIGVNDVIIFENREGIDGFFSDSSAIDRSTQKLNA